ncbi:hypothetical protein TcWFU_005364 [Taenia crassiceps]|uniref:Uncharacterized protein n=2 Tax=Taenia crassiceps TaxID=6207 RepID=A0ABR4QLG1_9CEST
MEGMMYPGAYVLKAEPETQLMLAPQPPQVHSYQPVLTPSAATQFAHTSPPPMMMHQYASPLTTGPTTEFVHTSPPLQMFPHTSVLKTEPTTEVMLAPQSVKMYAYPSPFADSIHAQASPFH